MSQSAYSEQIAELIKQAEETLRAGDPESARMIFEAVLQVDPENREAIAAIERLGVAGADLPASGGLPLLEVDFELAAASPGPPAPQRPPPSPPTAPAPAASDVAGEALEDLLEAADGLPLEDRLAAGVPKTAAARAAEGEAALLAEQARRLLYQGDVDKATEIASRALAMHEGCGAAQEILDEARAEIDRRASTAEHLLSEGIATVERGEPHHAIGMLQQVLQLAPNHAEALEWLARARQLVREARALHGAVTAETGPMVGPPTGSVAEPRAAAPSAPAPPSAGVADFTFEPTATPPVPVAPPASAGRYAAGVAKDSPPVDAPLATLGQAKRSRAPIPVAGSEAAQAAQAVHAAETTAPSLPPPPPPAPVHVDSPADRPLIGKAARAGRPPASRKLLLPLAIVLLLTVAGGAWWLGPMLGLWGGPEETSVAAAPVAPKKPLKPAAAPGAPKLTKADVPRLLIDAKLAIVHGDEKTGFALIQQAAALDPAHKEAAQLNMKVQHAIASRAEREDRMAHLANSYQNQDFGEVLRILYRLPKDDQPANIGKLIADASFNLGLQLMRTGDPYGAREYLKDTLERRPRDAEAQRLLDLVRKYRNKTRDEAYYESLATIDYRPLEELASPAQ